MRDSLFIIQGAGTRLAQSFLANPSLRASPCHLIARNEDDYAKLKKQFPHLPLIRAWEPDCLFPLARKVTVLLAALGPVHAESNDFEKDMRAVQRDMGFVRRILDHYPAEHVHLIYVSSVLALAPRKARRYYVGWKLLVEGTLAQWSPSLSVLYPGRLVETRSITRPVTHLFSTYSQAAKAASVLALEARPARRRVLGRDSRILLLLRSFTNPGMVLGFQT